MGNVDRERAAWRHADERLDAYIEELRRLCRIPSVSAEGRHMEEAAECVAAMMRESGLQARLLPAGDGFPAVYGEIEGDSDKTLLFYDHYDVMPADPLDEWHTDPFGGEVRDGRIYARGVSDNKGNIAARLMALRSILATRGRPPVTVKFLVEGEEETGSPNLGSVIEEHRGLLRADAAIWESGQVNHQGRPEVLLGVKGIFYVQLEVRGPGRDLHSSLGGLVTNPAWRLVWALTSLKGPDGRVAIEGFYDDVRPPTEADLELIAAIPDETEEECRAFGVDRLLDGLSGAAAMRRLLFEPTCTICGLTSGYQGPGTKTVLPAVARGKVDFRLVPGQTVERIERLLRAHLERHGFADVTVRNDGSEDGARTDPTAPIVGVVHRGLERAYGLPPVVHPTAAGSGPMALFINELGVDTASFGVGHPDAKVHSPDENVRVEDYRRGIKAVISVLEEMGADG